MSTEVDQAKLAEYHEKDRGKWDLPLRLGKLGARTFILNEGEKDECEAIISRDPILSHAYSEGRMNRSPYALWYAGFASRITDIPADSIQEISYNGEAITVWPLGSD